MTYLQKKTHIEIALAVISAKHNAKLKLSLPLKTDDYYYSIWSYTNSSKVFAWVNGCNAFATLDKLYENFFNATSTLEFYDFNRNYMTVIVVDEVGLTFEEANIAYDLLS